MLAPQVHGVDVLHQQGELLGGELAGLAGVLDAGVVKRVRLDVDVGLDVGVHAARGRRGLLLLLLRLLVVLLLDAAGGAG